MDEPNCFIELYERKGGGLTFKKTKSKPIKVVEISAARNGLIYFLNKLGFRESVILNRFMKLHESHFWDYNIMMFIVEYSVKKTRKMLVKDKKVNSIDYYLYKIGFKRHVINKLLPVLNPLLETTISIPEIIEIGIKYLLGFNNPITNDKTKYLFNLPENRWNNHQNHLVYNYNKSCWSRDINEIKTIIQENNVSDKDYTLYYHTTNWKSHKHIMKNIRSDMGRNCLDFGSTPSFYLNLDVSNAIEWGEKSKYTNYNELCIIIFKIPNSFLNTKEVPVKIFKEADKEWKDLTRKSRLCKFNILDDCGLILGPMVANPSQVQYGAMPTAHNPEKIQLACRKDIICSQLNSYIMGSIFFNKLSNK